MSFLCLLYAPPFNPRPAPSAAATRLTFVRCSYLKRAFKTSSDLFASIKQSSETKENLRRRGLFRIGSSIGIACLVDCCAELFMESFCLLINLWMVFGANKPIDMVLNSLALEFIKDIGARRDMCCSAPVLPFASHAHQTTSSASSSCKSQPLCGCNCNTFDLFRALQCTLLSSHDTCRFAVSLSSLSHVLHVCLHRDVATPTPSPSPNLTTFISPSISNEYPAIVATIEERLREKSYASSDTYKNPKETLYGRFCMLLIDPLAQWAFFAAYFFTEFVSGFASNIDDWRKRIPFWLLLGPVCLALWLVAISIVVAGVGFFLALYLVPMWFWMFGFKYFLHIARFVAVVLSFLTPLFILVFLFYSPICKRVSSDP